MARRPTPRVITADRCSTSNPVVRELESFLPARPHQAPFDVIATHIGTLGRDDRRRLLAVCKEVLAQVELRKIDAVRIVGVKTLVALAPDSADAITSLINTRSGPHIYEVHFSLFCFLDRLPCLSNATAFASLIPSILESYLLDVRAASAYAAWMAGDMLGDHWPSIPEALSVLVKAAKQARFVAGRNGALHGLEHILTRLPLADAAREPVVSLLRDISSRDRSTQCRRTALWILQWDRRHVAKMPSTGRVAPHPQPTG